MGGVIDERHAKKITDVYEMALKNGAPVIGVFNSNGTEIFAVGKSSGWHEHRDAAYLTFHLRSHPGH